MEIIQTKKIFEASKRATRIEIERILAVRQPNYSDFYLKNLEKGLAGEEKILAFLELYGEKDWKGIRNMWLNDNGKFECDFLLLAKSGLHMFEIKHYNGHFVYADGDCFLNNKVLPDNPITQTKRNYRKLKSIISRFNPNLKVFGTLLFVGEHNTVEIHSPISDITIVKPTELKEYILKIAEAERYLPQAGNTNSLINHLEKYEDTNYFVPKPLGSNSIKKLRKGIYCANCQSFQVTISKLYINCQCGFKEKREMATLRTLCELNVLTMKGKITQGEALNFINQQATGKYLVKIMNRHFIRIEKGRHTYYVTELVPFDKNKFLKYLKNAS